MIDLFLICVCLLNCLLLFREGALKLEAVDGQFCTDEIDSSDAVTEGVERCLFDGFSAAEALVAAFRFRLLGAPRFQWMTTANPLGPRQSYFCWWLWWRCYNRLFWFCGHSYSKSSSYI